MGEPIWSCVKIKTPRSWGNPDFVRLDDPGAAPDFIEVLADYLYTGYDPVECEVAEDGNLVWTMQGEANYGRSGYEESLAFMREHHIPYASSDDAKYEYPGSTEYHDGHDVWEVEESAGESVLTFGEWQRICKEWDHAPVGVLAAVQAHFARATWDIYAADVSHLGERSPDYEPEDDETPEGAMEVTFL